MNYKESKEFISIKRQKNYVVRKIYHGLCSRKEKYVGELKRNMATKWGEHNDPTVDSKPGKHFSKNIQYSYNWTVLASISKHAKTKKKLEAVYITLLRHSLNHQIKST